MRKAITAIVALITVISTLCIITLPSAKAETQEEILNEGEYYYFEFWLESDEQLSYSINVVSGPNVDVFLMDYTEFAKYDAGDDFLVFVDGSADDVQSFDYCLTGEGTYYLVIDNTDAGVAYPPDDFINDQVIFEFTYEKDISDEASLLFDLAVILIIIIVIVVIVVLLLHKRKKDKMRNQGSIVPPPPYQAPAQPQPIQPAFKFCNNCGAQLAVDSAFCPKCGGKQ